MIYVLPTPARAPTAEDGCDLGKRATAPYWGKGRTPQSGQRGTITTKRHRREDASVVVAWDAQSDWTSVRSVCLKDACDADAADARSGDCAGCAEGARRDSLVSGRREVIRSEPPAPRSRLQQ